MMRDRLAAALCNFILRTLASEHYRKMVQGSVLYGLASAQRDQAEGRTSPGLPRTARPGERLPPLPESAYPPGAVPLEPPPALDGTA